MAGFKCPYCNQHFTLVPNTNCNSINIYLKNGLATKSPEGELLFELHSFRCPNNECSKATFILSGYPDADFGDMYRQLLPEYNRTQPPAFIPSNIQKDYLEASSIVELSPKASATLSRRCLQSMIRDFWGITRANLHQEILALRGKVDDELVEALLAVKSIGNIGAHPENNSNIDLILDVEPDEASSLLDMIEFLFDEWYVARSKKKGLFAHLREVRDSKEKG